MKTYKVTVEENGTTKWFNKDGECHREGGPALEYFNGTKFWYTNGRLHREDGPAIEYADGDKEWWVNSKELPEEEFNSNFEKLLTFY